MISRPPRTPDALLLAMARIAPHRLSEMQRQKDEAFSLAAQGDTLGPVRGWLAVWAGEVEIERRPDLAARRRAAERTAQTLDKDAPAWRKAADELLAVVNEAREAAG
ncbi:hypothetical protein E1283_33300 [Streptomyces hainanensis]|uniref:Uncharacterized protein n=2 Tax=Streptomyces hainanensis TaxID=402648 RepID=A0A4R4SLD7_9ACTN|nr:hypothetical protein E1283_33300 [Streptomyces hainanensis]